MKKSKRSFPDSAKSFNPIKKQARLEHTSYRAILMRKYRAQKTAQSHPRKRGRPRKITIEDDLWLKKRVKKVPHATLRVLVKSFTKCRHAAVHSSTLSRHLTSMGLKSKLQTKKPLLTADHQQKRLDFCNSNKQTNWKKVLFTDETSIWLSPRRRRVRTLPGRPVFLPTKKYTPKVHVWGCMATSGFGEIHVFESNMTAEIYKSILQKHLLSSAHTLFPRRYRCTWRLQHDNDPKHSSKLVKKWLSENNIRVLPWPAPSPDLNPIENVWALLKKKVDECHPASLRGLREAAQKSWSSLDEGLARNLVSSMNRRINAVLEAQGKNTKY